MHRVLYCLLPLAAAAAMPAQAQTGGAWRVSEVTGSVAINESGRTRPATRGALLSGGSVIAGARSRAVLVRGRQYVVVSPGSTLRLGAAAKGGNAASMVNFVLEAGNAVFKVDRRENPHFRVQTRYLAAVVRGTTFSVTVTDTGGSVQVTEGAVQVSTLDGGASDLIKPGMIARIGASDLYRLTISGDQERVIRSPKAPAGAVTTPAGQPVAQAVPGNGRGQGVGRVRITAPVGESPLGLGQATGGVVKGAPAITFVLRGRGDDPADHDRGSGNDRDRDERGGRGLGRVDGDFERAERSNRGGDKDKDPGKDKDDKDKDGKDDKDGPGPSDGSGDPKDKDKDKDPPADDGKDKPGDGLPDDGTDDGKDRDKDGRDEVRDGPWGPDREDKPGKDRDDGDKEDDRDAPKGG